MISRLALVAVCLLFAQAAGAQHADYQVSVGVRASDNISREADGSSGATATAGFVLDAERKTGVLQFKSTADLDFLHYFSQRFSNEVVGQLTGTATYAFVPQTFEWVLDEHFGQVSTDYFLAPGPQNRQFLNLFSTGPDLRIRLANQLKLRLSGRYGRDDYETSLFSATRLVGEGALERRPSEATLLSLGARREKVSYQSAVVSPGDFAVKSYFAGYYRAGGRTSIDIQGGYSENSGGLAQLRGAIGHVEISRKVGRSGRVTVAARRVLDSVSPGSRASDFLPGVQNRALAEVLTGTLYFSDAAELRYRWQRPRDSLDIAAGIGKETDHRDFRPDRDVQQIGAKLSHRLTPLADAAVYARWSRDTLYDALFPGFPRGDFRSNDKAFGLQLRRRFSQVFAATIDLSHVQRSALIGSYHESAAWLRLIYAPLPLHSTSTESP